MVKDNEKAKKIDPDQVHHLAFEGGGGKGITYLGAIKALCSKEIHDPPLLPIRKGGPIRGISGASAGAITALFLALGWNHKRIESELKDKDFRDFFDASKPGWIRAVEKDNHRAKWRVPYPQDMWRSKEFQEKRENSISKIIKAIEDLILSALPGPVEYVAKALRSFLYLSKDYRDLRRRAIEGFYAIIFDQGMHAGFAVREYFRKKVQDFLTKEVKLEDRRRYLGMNVNPDFFTFQQLHSLTGIDLRVTGVNLSTGRPQIFSLENTPTFPVAEAISISMNIPFLFKPVWIQGWRGAKAQEVQKYRGFWIDGGLLNNYPIHAFDTPHFGVQNKNILGFRLMDGYPSVEEKKQEPAEFPSDQMLIWDLFASFAQALCYPCEEGQIISEQDRMQTIPLFTYDLKMMDFNPPSKLRRKPILQAEKAVYDYFEIAIPDELKMGLHKL